MSTTVTNSQPWQRKKTHQSAVRNLRGIPKFLIKVGGHPGIPVRVELIESEPAINDTNKLWRAQTSFPEPDESNPVVGLDGAAEVAHDLESVPAEEAGAA